MYTKLDKMIRNESELNVAKLALRRDAGIACISEQGMILGIMVEDNWYSGTDRWCPVVTNEEAVQSGIKWGVLSPRNISDGPCGSYATRANSRLNWRLRPSLIRRIALQYGLNPDNAVNTTSKYGLATTIVGAYCMTAYRYSVGGYRGGNPPDLIVRRVATWRARNPEMELNEYATSVLKNIVSIIWNAHPVYVRLHGGLVTNWLSDVGLITGKERELMVKYIKEIRASM